MNWFQRTIRASISTIKTAQNMQSDPRQILAAILLQAGKDNNAIIESVASRFQGVPREQLEQALMYAQAEASKQNGGQFNDAQHNIIGQVQSLITGSDLGIQPRQLDNQQPYDQQQQQEQQPMQNVANADDLVKSAGWGDWKQRFATLAMSIAALLTMPVNSVPSDTAQVDNMLQQVQRMTDDEQRKRYILSLRQNLQNAGGAV